MILGAFQVIVSSYAGDQVLALHHTIGEEEVVRVLPNEIDQSCALRSW